MTRVAHIDLCAIAGDMVAKCYQAKGYLAIIDHTIYEWCDLDAMEKVAKS